MKSFTKFTAVALVLVAFLAGMTYSVTSPYGRNGIGGIDTGEDHPWGGDQIINDPTPTPNPGPTTMTSTTTTTTTIKHMPIICTGQTWIDIFLNRLFYRHVYSQPRTFQKRPVVTPVTPNTDITTTTRSGSGSTN